MKRRGKNILALATIAAVASGVVAALLTLGAHPVAIAGVVSDRELNGLRPG